MPTFTYKALDNEKKVVTGQLAAKDRNEVAQSLQKRGLSPLIVKEVKKTFKIRGGVPKLEKITFCRYISTMLNSGLSLSEGVEVLQQETKNPLMKQILGDISYSLEQGQQLSAVFERYPHVFESYFLTLTRAGELSGTLAEVFKYLEMQLRAEYRLVTKIKGTLLYPVIVFTATLAIGILMFFFVLPQIAKVFTSLSLPLPLFTQLLFKFSLFLSRNTLPIIIAGIISAVVGFFVLRIKEVKDFLILFIRPFPLVRDLIKKADLARFTRIFSTLLKSAVPITEALEIALSSLTWRDYRAMGKVLPEDIRKGKTLSIALKERKVFPPLIMQMVAAGEKSGTLDVLLADIAYFYEEEVEEELKNLTQILEPILMLLVGTAVGVMILAIIAPIYSVVANFQQAAGTPGI